MQIHHEIFTILLYDFQSDGKDGLIKIQLPQGHHPLEAAINILVSLATTVFEIHQKSRIQYCERSELRLHFKYQKFIESAKNGQFGNFLKN